MSHKIGLWRGVQIPLTSTALTFFSPRIPARWADEIVWNLAVEGVTNAPAALSVRVDPQVMLEHSRSQLEENRFQAGQTPLWSTVTPANSHALLDGGFGEVANLSTIAAVASGDPLASGTIVATADPNNGAGVLFVSRRQAAGCWARLAFDTTYTANALAAGTGDTTAGSNVITNVSSTFLAGVSVGQVITGPGLAAVSYVKSKSGSSITLRDNALATATATGVALSMAPPALQISLEAIPK